MGVYRKAVFNGRYVTLSIEENQSGRDFSQLAQYHEALSIPMRVIYQDPQ